MINMVKVSKHSSKHSHASLVQDPTARYEKETNV